MNEGWDERINVVQCSDLVNSFIITTQRYVILVDTLISPETASELFNFARPKLTDGRSLIAINTHADWDHCWGNQLFAGVWPVIHIPILGTRLTAERLRSDAEKKTLAEMQIAQPGVFDKVTLIPPTITFEHDLSIDGGDLTLKLFSTPGHQPDHISIFIPEISLLLAGDAAEFPFPFAHSAQTLPDLRTSLTRMLALNPAYTLYCHAPVASGSKILQENVTYFDQLEARCREAIAQGIPGKPAEDADVVKLIDYPLDKAVPPLQWESYPPFYTNGHAAQIRLMLEWVAANPR
jgi:glyoxylase-like metal-dependent hydrolase (beta-lactamase superfamily II)